MTADWVGGPMLGQDPYLDLESLVRGIHGELTIFNSGGYGVWSGGTLRGMPEV